MARKIRISIQTDAAKLPMYCKWRQKHITHTTAKIWHILTQSERK